MAIALSEETQKLIEQRMKESGVDTADELVRVALQTLDQVRGEDFEDLDAETRAAIEEGLAQADRGEGRPWAEVREELRARFIKEDGGALPRQDDAPRVERHRGDLHVHRAEFATECRRRRARTARCDRRVGHPSLPLQ